MAYINHSLRIFFALAFIGTHSTNLSAAFSICLPSRKWVHPYLSFPWVSAAASSISLHFPWAWLSKNLFHFLHLPFQILLVPSSVPVWIHGIFGTHMKSFTAAATAETRRGNISFDTTWYRAIKCLINIAIIGGYFTITIKHQPAAGELWKPQCKIDS